MFEFMLANDKAGRCNLDMNAPKVKKIQAFLEERKAAMDQLNRLNASGKITKAEVIVNDGNMAGHHPMAERKKILKRIALLIKDKS